MVVDTDRFPLDLLRKDKAMSDMLMGIFLWLVTDPIHMAIFGWIGGAIVGYLVGYSVSTRPIEIDRDQARRDLSAIKRTIKIVVVDDNMKEV